MQNSRQMKTMEARIGRNSRKEEPTLYESSYVIKNLNSSNTVARPVIPKRGEKEYEPSGDKGTDLQQYKLDRIRDAMFSALDVERTVSRYESCTYYNAHSS